MRLFCDVRVVCVCGGPSYRSAHCGLGECCPNSSERIQEIKERHDQVSTRSGFACRTIDRGTICTGISAALLKHLQIRSTHSVLISNPGQRLAGVC